MTDAGAITALGDRVRERLAGEGAGEALNLSLVICNAGVLNTDKIFDEGGLDYKSIEHQIQVNRLKMTLNRACDHQAVVVGDYQKHAVNLISTCSIKILIVPRIMH